MSPYLVTKGHVLVTLGCLGPSPFRRSYRTVFWTLWMADSIWSATSLLLTLSLRLLRCALKSSQHNWSRPFSSKASELKRQQSTIHLNAWKGKALIPTSRFLWQPSLLLFNLRKFYDGNLWKIRWNKNFKNKERYTTHFQSICL